LFKATLVFCNYISFSTSSSLFLRLVEKTSHDVNFLKKQ